MFVNYLREEDCIKIFANWPVQLNQRVGDMADAGFFYTGIRDLVVCFSCGVECCDWFRENKPWVEHAFASADAGCQYLIAKKGV